MLKFQDLCDIILFLFYSEAWSGPGRVRGGAVAGMRPEPISTSLHLKAVQELIGKGWIQSYSAKGAADQNRLEYGISRDGIDRVESCLEDADSVVSHFRIQGDRVLADRSPARQGGLPRSESLQGGLSQGGLSGPSRSLAESQRAMLRSHFESIGTELAEQGDLSVEREALLRTAIALLRDQFSVSHVLAAILDVLSQVKNPPDAIGSACKLLASQGGNVR